MNLDHEVRSARNALKRATRNARQYAAKRPIIGVHPTTLAEFEATIAQARVRLRAAIRAARKAGGPPRGSKGHP